MQTNKNIQEIEIAEATSKTNIVRPRRLFHIFEFLTHKCYKMSLDQPRFMKHYLRNEDYKLASQLKKLD